MRTQAAVGIVFLVAIWLFPESRVLEWIIWGVGLLCFLAWCLGIRMTLRSTGTISMGTVMTTLLFLVSLLVTLEPGYSKFHLMWLYPACIGVGTLTVILKLKLFFSRVPRACGLIDIVWAPCYLFLSIVRLITVYTRDPDGRRLLAEKGALLPPPIHQQPITLRQAIGGFEPLDARANLRSVSDPLHRVKSIGQQYEAVRNTQEGRCAFVNQCATCGCRDNAVFKGKQGAHLSTRCVAAANDCRVR